MKKIVLASTSPFRAEILKKLGLSFSTASPNCDETELQGETHTELVKRLSEAKARSIQLQKPNHYIIGSDQVADLEGKILTKPHTHKNAVLQLTACSGKTITFHTGLCLLDASSGHCQVDSVEYQVTFRQLNELQIERYLSTEKPYNCAGSFKSEGLGITLFEKFHGEDPNALVGLPLIRLCDMFKNAGITLP